MEPRIMLAAAGVLPAAIPLSLVWRPGPAEREPIGLVLIIYLTSMLTVVVVLPVELLLSRSGVGDRAGCQRGHRGGEG